MVDIIGLPDIFFPRITVIYYLKIYIHLIVRFLAYIISNFVWNPIPTAALPGLELNSISDAKFNARSSDRFRILLTFTPGAVVIHQQVTVGGYLFEQL